MNRTLIWLPLLGAVLLFGLVGYALWKPADRTVHSAMIGKPMPAITCCRQPFPESQVTTPRGLPAASPAS